MGFLELSVVARGTEMQRWAKMTGDIFLYWQTSPPCSFGRIAGLCKFWVLQLTKVNVCSSSVYNHQQSSQAWFRIGSHPE